MIIREVWKRAKGTLASAKIIDAGLEAEVLIRLAMGDVDRPTFFASLSDSLEPNKQYATNVLVRRRLLGEPLAYIKGTREFYGLDMQVNPNVLIPRQETELLVDQVLDFCKTCIPDEKPLIADVGTGSGAIAVALALNLPTALIWAIDSSKESLDVTSANSRKHNVSHKIQLRHGDLLNQVNEHFDIIVSNPPYLDMAELAGVRPELHREPVMALNGGLHGLEITRRLLEQARSHLKPNGLLAVEINPCQRDVILNIAKGLFLSAKITYVNDLMGLPRALLVKMDGSQRLRPDPKTAL